MSSYYHTHAASVSSSKVVKTRIRRGKNYTLPKQVPVKLKPAAGYLEFGLKAGNRREQMKQYQCCCFSSAFIKLGQFKFKTWQTSCFLLTLSVLYCVGCSFIFTLPFTIKVWKAWGEKKHISQNSQLYNQSYQFYFSVVFSRQKYLHLI